MGTVSQSVYLGSLGAPAPGPTVTSAQAWMEFGLRALGASQGGEPQTQGRGGMAPRVGKHRISSRHRDSARGWEKLPIITNDGVPQSPGNRRWEQLTLPQKDRPAMVLRGAGPNTCRRGDADAPG